MLLQYAGLRFYVMGSAGSVWIGKSRSMQTWFFKHRWFGSTKKSLFAGWFDENVLRVGVQKIYLTHWDDFFPVFNT